MMTLWQFRILKYVSDPIRNEPVNIGILLCEAGKRVDTVSVQVTANWHRVLCIDPHADTQLLSGLERHLRALFATSDKTFSELGQELEQQFNNAIQVSDEKAVQGEDAIATLNRLMAMFVDPPKP